MHILDLTENLLVKQVKAYLVEHVRPVEQMFGRLVSHTRAHPFELDRRSHAQSP